MLVRQAKDLARQWVSEEGVNTPGFVGAYHTGSINWQADDDVIAATSDVDVMVVCDTADGRGKLGKFGYGGAILEVSYTPLQSAEQVLGNYHLAGGFHVPSVIADPTGHLTRLQVAVAKDYAKRGWVQKRCEDARASVLVWLSRVDQAPLYHDRVACWSFGAGVLCHVVLVAGLENPTVRRRYMTARQLLERHGHLDLYESMLEVAGFAKLSCEGVSQHLDAVTEAFDVARSIIKAPYRFAADISEIGRPVAIGGSRELIDAGYHREAMFWVLATYSRCQQVLLNDADVAAQEKYGGGYRSLLADLGIASPADLAPHSEHVATLLPHVWDVAQEIMHAK